MTLDLAMISWIEHQMQTKILTSSKFKTLVQKNYPKNVGTLKDTRKQRQPIE